MLILLLITGAQENLFLQENLWPQENLWVQENLWKQENLWEQELLLHNRCIGVLSLMAVPCPPARLHSGAGGVAVCVPQRARVGAAGSSNCCCWCWRS